MSTNIYLGGLVTREELGPELAGVIDEKLAAAPREGTRPTAETIGGLAEIAAKYPDPAVRRRPYKAVMRELEELKAQVAGSLINRATVETLALDLSEKMRRGKFTRVSKEFLDEIEAQVRSMVVSRVHRAPGVGKTL